MHVNFKQTMYVQSTLCIIPISKDTLRNPYVRRRYTYVVVPFLKIQKTHNDYKYQIMKNEYYDSMYVSCLTSTAFTKSLS